MSKHPSFAQLRAALPHLTLKQAKDLQRELERVIQELEQPTEPLPTSNPKREVLQVQREDDRLYQLERVRCGKPTCKCAGELGELHGPYWYAYWRVDGKLKSRYIGKKLR